MSLIKHPATTALLCASLFSNCTQKTQNKFGRAVHNRTGTEGVLDIYAGNKLVNQFIDIDQVTTAVSTQGSEARPYCCVALL